MGRVDEIRERLKVAFTEQQADVIARVLVEVFPVPAPRGAGQSPPGDRGDVAESRRQPERPGETS